MYLKKIFLNGEFLPIEHGMISVHTHSFCMGTGCLEGIRGYWSQKEQQLFLFRLREHFVRLHHSCRILHIALPYTVEDLAALTIELIRQNDVREDIYVRIVAFKSEESLNIRLHGVSDSFVMTLMPMGNFIDITGLKCEVSSWRRIDDNAVPARAKVSGGYVNSALARSQALQNGCDEAILLNNDGHVSEGSTENIFLVMQGAFVTPAPSENILLGITRDTVMQFGRQVMGRPTCERAVDRTELYLADEIFLCGTGAQIAPVVNIDHRPIGDGKVGPVTREIQDLYFQVVRGEHPRYKEQWCTPAYGTGSAHQA